ncbi:MAG TPA: MaoC family dehydratase [Candidatus Dormibacteraeota bacterium]|nr:MaoC family dehydratase [Candidatus Dormibacteraeota bacterium]
MAGDFSPLAVDTTSAGGTRQAPPALLVAMAVGLGSMDTPIPQIAAWEWVNWKFPKAVRAGETIYARWTLTQKRPPVHGSPSAIAVWRVDVHTADGEVCAEGEIGASVFRRTSAAQPAERAAEPVATGPRRRRRRRGGGAAETAAAPAAPAPKPAAAPKQAPTSDRTPGSSRRRRRKRSGPPGNGNGGGDHPEPSPQPEPAPAPVTAAPPAPAPAAPASASPLRAVMRRLRRS